MRAIITVTGKDTVGIIAKVSKTCAEYNANITDITQKVFDDLFVMIMLADTDRLSVRFTEFADRLSALGQANNLDIRAMHEDIFDAMHKI